LAKQSLLVVDADPRSLRILEVALRKAGFAVATAADGAEALRKVQRNPPDLLLCEMNVAGQDGVSLCRALRDDGRLSALPVFLMSADRAPATRTAALEAGADDFLAKPLLIKELVARIRALLAHREQARYAQRSGTAALTGSVGDLGLVDLFTSLENWQKTATVYCDSGDGRSARVWVRDGQVIDAEVDPVAGEAAFYRLLNWGSGSFRVEFGPVDREPRTEAGTQGLLMEGMRRIDEMARLAEALPFATVLGVDFAALAARLADMPDELNGVLRLFDGRRTVREVVSESPLDDLSTMAAVQRLVGDGVLVQGAAAGPPRAKPTLQQWLGSAVAPAVREEQPAPSEQVESPAPAPAGAKPAVRTAGPIELIRYPALRGMRRERLRREAEEARQAVSAGRPVRLTHVLELPPTPGGSDAPTAGARRMSVAVGDAAKRFAPDLPVSRVVRPWVAPGGSPEAPAAVAAEAEQPPPRAAAEAVDEISAALADAASAAESGAEALDAMPPRRRVVNPGALPDAAAPATGPAFAARLGALRLARGPADGEVVAAAPVTLRPRRWQLAVAAVGIALVGAAFLAVVLRQSQRATPPVEAAEPVQTAAATSPVAAPATAAPPPAAPAAAPEIVRESATAPPVDPNEYARALANGETLLKRGKYRAAVAEFRKAVELRPDSVPALLALGDAYLESDQLRNAVKPLQQAAQLDQKNARAQLLLGTVFQGLGRERDAVAAYRRYLDLDPRGEFAGDVRAIVANLSR
jgi:CheY-like chemotaxis protein/tetratricopeptide (TPR) repeat protein